MKIREVPLEDRMQLVEDVRDSIAEEQGVPAISDEQRRELDRRLEAYRISNEPGAPALEAIERIRAEPWPFACGRKPTATGTASGRYTH